jgi:hypothetical protein
MTHSLRHEEAGRHVCESAITVIGRQYHSDPITTDSVSGRAALSHL